MNRESLSARGAECPGASSVPSPVLITGAGGFIGSHLAERCVALGCKVRAFVHYNSNNRWGWLDNSPFAADMEIVAGDIRDYDMVTGAINGCKTVLHLAALVGIPYSYISPLAYIRTNIEGTYNVLQAARTIKPDVLVVTSTSETYGSAQYVPIDEDHPKVGQSPYAATKIAADQLALSYHRSFGLPVTVARPFNTYGPRQSARAIIPTVITQILQGKEVIQMGNTHATRDLTFVKDTVEGLLAIACAGDLTGTAVNIGMNEEISMGNLVKKIAALMDAEIAIETDSQRVRPGPSEVERLRCDNAKVLAATSWRPAYTLETGLKETITWIQDNQGLYKPEIYNI